MKARDRWLAFVFLIGFQALLLGCTDSGTTPTEISPDFIRDNGETVWIVDQAGRSWDVTHARDVYGMDPARFQFGLGQDAIPPILNPEIIHEGHPDYPEDWRDFLVIATEVNGDPRAYELAVMYTVEVADETFGNTHVAVAY